MFWPLERTLPKVTDDIDLTFEAMARQFPARTGVYTVGPPVVGLAQLLNSYVHGVSLLYAGLFTVLLLAFSVVITRYHLASYRVTLLTGEWLQTPGGDAPPRPKE